MRSDRNLQEIYMEEHEVWSQPDDLLLNGLLRSEVGNVTRLLVEERWAKAEQRTAELLASLQPSQPSEERRNDVANYVQKLLTKRFSFEVFTFGSVPLKTYLPDGDIDLTAFNKNEDLKYYWANEVREVLENEEKSDTAEFRVKSSTFKQSSKCLATSREAPSNRSMTCSEASSSRSMTSVGHVM